MCNKIDVIAAGTYFILLHMKPICNKIKQHLFYGSIYFIFIAYKTTPLSSGYIWNKTETKQFCFSCISDVVTCNIKQKQL